MQPLELAPSFETRVEYDVILVSRLAITEIMDFQYRLSCLVGVAPMSN